MTIGIYYILSLLEGRHHWPILIYTFIFNYIKIDAHDRIIMQSLYILLRDRKDDNEELTCWWWCLWRDFLFIVSVIDKDSIFDSFNHRIYIVGWSISSTPLLFLFLLSICQCKRKERERKKSSEDQTLNSFGFFLSIYMLKKSR